MATLPVIPFQYNSAGPANASETGENFDELLKYIGDRNAGTVSWDSLSVIGNITITTGGNGIIFTTPDGLRTYKLSADNNGNMNWTELT